MCEQYWLLAGYISNEVLRDKIVRLLGVVRVRDVNALGLETR